MQKIRVQWCKQYQLFTMENWKNVVYSDESLFHLYQKTLLHIRRPMITRFIKKYTLKTVKYGGLSVMVWSAIKGDGSRVLQKCSDHLKSIGYQDILDSALHKI